MRCDSEVAPRSPAGPRRDPLSECRRLSLLLFHSRHQLIRLFVRCFVLGAKQSSARRCDDNDNFKFAANCWLIRRSTRRPTNLRAKLVSFVSRRAACCCCSHTTSDGRPSSRARTAVSSWRQQIRFDGRGCDWPGRPGDSGGQLICAVPFVSTGTAAARQNVGQSGGGEKVKKKRRARIEFRRRAARSPPPPRQFSQMSSCCCCCLSNELSRRPSLAAEPKVAIPS